MGCPNPTLVQKLLQGRLSRQALSHAQAHVADCETCRGRLAELSRSRSDAPPQEEATTDELQPSRPEVHPEPELDRVFGRRYRLLDRLGQGGMGLVFRALDRLTGQPIALKLVALSSPSRSPPRPWLAAGIPAGDVQSDSLPSGGSGGSMTSEAGAPRSHLAALAQEFRILVTLRHPNIISVLDYGFDAGRPYFTMELLSEARPLLPLARTAPPAIQFDLLMQLLRALTYLHRRGIVHRDLKPSNILVCSRPAGLSVKVLDFGLAMHATDRPKWRRAGTLHYMAPEVLRGAVASEASDLYAVGVMAYQILTGRHPSAPSGAGSSVPAPVHMRPELAALPPKLRVLLERTLSMQPADRPADAMTFLRELADAAGTALPTEPLTVRDSYLVSARFVGRAAELKELTQALAAARVGHGAAFLIGGESGVGKSRLLEELRSLALLEGVLVVRGQAISSGGTSYQLWQGVLPVLALHVELDDLEASVLGSVVPELPALLERPVAALPALDSQSAWLRLLHVLRDIVLRPSTPVVLLLEDLHWADAESLALLTQVSSNLAGRPLLVVATYRQDEAPRLSRSLPALQPMKVERLGRLDIGQLCESMLGPSGRDAELLELIGRETEGNTYFIIEVLRALAEESGSLDEIGRRRLPARVFAGGIENVLERRLRRVPQAARELLALAAVMGRQLQPLVLAALFAKSDELIDQCVEAGVFDLYEQRWRFSHDQLRERVLAEQSLSEQRRLHHLIAETLENLYPASAVPAAQVAHHYHQAEQPARAAHYYSLAGTAALQRGAPAEAAAALELAVKLHRQLPVPLLEQVRVWRRLTQARYGLGQLSATDAALRQVCARVGSPLPTQPLQLGQALGRQLIEQLVRRAGLVRSPRRAPKTEHERLLEQELLLALMSDEIYVWRSEPVLTLLCIVWGLNLAEALDAQPQHTHFRAGAAFLLSFTRLGGLGLRFLDRGPTAAKTIGEIDALRIKAMVALHQGRWSSAVESAVQAVAQARAQKDDFALMYSLLQQQLALVELDDFAQVLTVSTEMERLAVMAQNPRYVVLALIGQIGTFLRFGELARTEPLFARAQGARELGPVLEAALHGLGAMCALRQQQWQRARQLADAAMAAVKRVRWPLLQLRYALIGILDVYLDPESVGTPEQIEQALSMLRWIGREFAVTQSTYSLYRGRYELRRGFPSRAGSKLRQSLSAAQKYGVRYDQAQAHYWLGRIAQEQGRSSGEDVAHFRAALELYKLLGAAWDADLVQQSLRTSCDTDHRSVFST